MQAVVLAGGKGTRLKPYTMSFPKPLVPVCEYPILEIIIRQLVRFGFNRITISTGYLAELIEAYFGDGKRWGASIQYVREMTPLSTAGALKLLRNCDENFLVMNGDILTNLNLQEFYDSHIENGAAATIASKKRESKIDFGVLKYAENGFLIDYIEKPIYSFAVSMGIYVISRPTLEIINVGEQLGMPEFLLRIKDAGDRVYCYQSDCYWLDIGRVDDYEVAQAEFETHRMEFLGSDA